MFVRLMRNLGYDFYRQDTYCENLFAKYFDLTDIDQKTGFEFVSAFEVFEHLVDPIAEINQMFEYSDTIIFSTNLQPDTDLKSTEDWWYFTPETGQHISLYHKNTFRKISELTNCHFYTTNYSIHILSKKKINFLPISATFFRHKISEKILGRHFMNRRSLLDNDMSHVKKILSKK